MLLEEPPNSEAREAAYAEDRETEGFVWTWTRLRAWNPEADQFFGDLPDRVTEESWQRSAFEDPWVDRSVGRTRRSLHMDVTSHLGDLGHSRGGTGGVWVGPDEVIHFVTFASDHRQQRQSGERHCTSHDIAEPKPSTFRDVPQTGLAGDAGPTSDHGIEGDDCRPLC